MYTMPTAVAGPAPETSIARDMAKRALWVAPAGLLVFGLIWGVPGALSTAFGILLVVANFGLSAFLLSRSARISPGLLMAAALFGFLIRMALLFAAVWAVHTLWWFAAVPLAITLVVTHLGLLAWEMRYVSASLAFPGLQPEPVAGPVPPAAQPAGPAAGAADPFFEAPVVDPAAVAAAILSDPTPKES